jgi:hypothetical protein
MKKVKIYLTIIALAIMLIGFSFYTININTGLTKSEVISIVHNLNPDSIEYFIIYPTSFSKTLLKDELFISDFDHIKKLSGELVKLKKYAPNHPMTDWSLIIKVKTKSKDLQDFFFEITKSDERNGTCIWLMKESFGIEFNLGTYRNDRLGQVLEEIINETTVANPL